MALNGNHDTNEIFYDVISIFGNLMLEEKTKDILYIAQLQNEIESLKGETKRKNDILDTQLSTIKNMNKKFKSKKRNRSYGLPPHKEDKGSTEDNTTIQDQREPKLEPEHGLEKELSPKEARLEPTKQPEYERKRNLPKAPEPTQKSRHQKFFLMKEVKQTPLETLEEEVGQQQREKVKEETYGQKREKESEPTSDSKKVKPKAKLKADPETEKGVLSEVTCSKQQTVRKPEHEPKLVLPEEPEQKSRQKKLMLKKPIKRIQVGKLENGGNPYEETYEAELEAEVRQGQEQELLQNKNELRIMPKDNSGQKQEEGKEIRALSKTEPKLRQKTAEEEKTQLKKKSMLNRLSKIELENSKYKNGSEICDEKQLAESRNSSIVPSAFIPYEYNGDGKNCYDGTGYEFARNSTSSSEVHLFVVDRYLQVRNCIS